MKTPTRARVRGFWWVGYGATPSKTGGGYGSSGGGGRPRRVGGYGAGLPRPCPRRARPSPALHPSAGGKKVGVAVGSCCYGISRMFCEQKKKKRQFAPAGCGASRSKLRRNGSLLLLARSLPRRRPLFSCAMGRFATVKALLSATPPQAVLISPPSDMLEESVLRSTSGGTLSSEEERVC